MSWSRKKASWAKRSSVTVPTLRQNGVAAVDDHGLAPDHLCRRRGEKADHLGDVAGLHQAACRRAALVPLEHRLPVGKVGERARLDQTGRDRVDADVSFGELDGEVADEGLERRLGDSDKHVVVQYTLRAEARRGDDGAAR